MNFAVPCWRYRRDWSVWRGRFRCSWGAASRDPLVQQRRPAMVLRQVWVPGSDGEAGGFIDVFDANGQQVFVPSTNPNGPDFVDAFDQNGQPVYVQGKTH